MKWDAMNNLKARQCFGQTTRDRISASGEGNCYEL